MCVMLPGCTWTGAIGLLVYQGQFEQRPYRQITYVTYLQTEKRQIVGVTLSGLILLHYQAIWLHYKLVVTLSVNLELHDRLLLHYRALNISGVTGPPIGSEALCGE